MRAIVASPSSDERIELRDIAAPSPASGETLVEVRAVSLNRGEFNRLASAEDGSRFGWDLAGVVKEQSADGQGPAAGTRVVGFVPNSAWAELVAVPNNRLAVLPDEVSFAQAAGLPVAGLTALRTLRRGGLLLGKRVLITGASGGVGRFAVQLAHLAGAHVTAVAGNEERAQAVRALGADATVASPDKLDRPFDLILESVGGSSLAAALGLIVPGGTIVIFGNSSMENTTVNISVFYRQSGASLQAFSLLAPSQPPDFGVDLSYLAALVASGQLNVDVGHQEKWTETAAALRAMRERRIEGKAVLLVE